MLTIANKGTYLVKKSQKYANVIYERPLSPYFQILMLSPLKETVLFHGNLTFG